ncbi:ABC transporter permease [Dyella mobilis]|uniref:ABC transporter permease n=1 Tax=Dyella mobilis TaxID=1849582 RepID=A0ABS2KF99_9GAMM|nr:ABC transporter permease [Dyella mobilis]MBM7129613.1 ABC transporter permease [Dyella mobilis]GLQ98123.1 ABC transporter ATP-binding protein [Dyella mobilis]
MFAYYLSLGFRSLRKAPILTALMVMSVAFGVGASMTTYAVFRAMSGDPIPWKSSKLYFPQLDVWGPKSRAGNQANGELPDTLTYTDAMALMRHRTDVPQTALYPIAPTVYPDDPTKKSVAVGGHAVYGDFFKIADTPFRYGSAWSAQDDQNHALLAVINSDLNERLFGGGNSVGKDLRLNDRTYRIVGVLDHWHPQPKFYDLANSIAFGPADDVFIPFTAAVDQQMPTNGGFGCGAALPASGFAGILNSNCVWVAYLVELDDASQVASFRTLLQGYLSDQQKAGRFDWPPNYKLRNLPAWMDLEQVVPPETKMSVVVASCFLLVCMVNAIGLLLAKFMRRSGEIGVRRAMGATRGAIALQFGVEAATIGITGGIIGLLLTWGGIAWMHHALPEDVAALTRIDVTLLAETLLLAIVSAILAGLYPILRASGVRPAMQLKID